MTSRSSASSDDGDGFTFALKTPNAGNPTHDRHTNNGKTNRTSYESQHSSTRISHYDGTEPGYVHGHDCETYSRGLNSQILLDTQLDRPVSTVTSGIMSTVSKQPTCQRNLWSLTPLVIVITSLATIILLTILKSFLRHEAEPKGCRMSYMRPSYVHFPDFDTEYTRFATKYSLYLYRELGIDDSQKLNGVPILFIPGNAGSYKQIRPIAAEAASYFYHGLHHDAVLLESGVRNLDFFTVDFNEDITAFHGQTLLDQAEYLNEAIRFILSLYSDPQRVHRDFSIPNPTAVVILGHSMGGIVARAMLIQPNYQPKSINTIITMSAPHAHPPVTFDGQIVHIYEEINDYWRNAYTQKWANDNPLWHVTLVSIAGGSLDTVVPSDYATLESLVPETHGFTVFTTGIPNVWTSMDHQSILWCDQFRKVVARALYDIIDVKRASQTKPRADRMRLLKKRFLPGIESTVERTITSGESTILLSLSNESTRIVPAGVRLSLSRLDKQTKPKAYLLPVPPRGSPDPKRFTLMTDISLDDSGANGGLEVLLCSVMPHQLGSGSFSFSSHIDLSDGSNAYTRLACKNAASDAILLPVSKPSTKYSSSLDRDSNKQPFSYLQYNPDHVADHQFVAVVDRSTSPLYDFVLAEFSGLYDSQSKYETSFAELLTLGLSLKLPADRPIVADIVIPVASSALLAFNLNVNQSWCHGHQKFSLIIRQYLDKPYESKYFINAKKVSVSFHGTAPFVPPPLDTEKQAGLGFQFWSDPACDSPLELHLKIDVWGSMGKLYIRYRTALAAFPLLVVTLVLRKQFRVYDETGVFISFSESLDLSLRRSIPLLLLSLTLFTPTFVSSSFRYPFRIRQETNDSAVGLYQNELLIGTQEPLFRLLLPLISIVCIGVCAVLHSAILGLTRALGLLLGLFGGCRSGESETDQHHRVTSSTFLSTTPSRRVILTVILMFLVSTFIPFQFAYLGACLVQVFTVVRAFRASISTVSTPNLNYYHYAHSILILMAWVLPINLPIIAVWVRNLAVHWLTPFSSHHNVLSIMPFIILVENLTAGQMVPQVRSWLSHVTSTLFFGTALCVAIYGMSHAYTLHYLVNTVAAWLIVLHSISYTWSWAITSAMFVRNVSNLIVRRKFS